LKIKIFNSQSQYYFDFGCLYFKTVLAVLATGYWLLATGYWLLATGYWLLATGI
jgi:hypothetical protein